MVGGEVGYGKGGLEREGRGIENGDSVHLSGVLSEAAAQALDKNSPNPSLITIPAKSEILTAAAADDASLCLWLRRGENGALLRN